MKNLKEIIDAAAGRIKCDLVFKNCRIVDVFSHIIVDGSLGVKDGVIVGIGDYDGEKIIDGGGRYLVPGFIDSHVHIESSMVSPTEFAKGIIPWGTTSIIADPHEIANVNGTAGIDYIMKASSKTPLDVFIMVPSCVPATEFENSGAVIDVNIIKGYIKKERVLGLGELMDYQAVVAGKDSIIKKIEAAGTKVIDGHGPMISGMELNAYAASGVRTEHECSTVEEMRERISQGIYILLRQGSAARNLEKLIKGVDIYNSRRCLFCTDDKHPQDILTEGHINYNIKLAVENGLDTITAIEIATINAAQCYGLNGKGAIAPSYDADLVLLEDLVEFKPYMVFKGGKLVAREGSPVFAGNSFGYESVKGRVKINISIDSFKIRMNKNRARVIKLIPRNLVTKMVIREVELENGEFKSERNPGLLKLAVIERHKETGNIGLGIIEGFGLKNGAIATTIAHDSHNLIVIGDNDRDMYIAAMEVKKASGGITTVSNGRVIDTLPLPIAGLMSDKNLTEVCVKLEEMINTAHEKLGVSRDYDPFMTLAFMALPVIPEIKLTDMGLLDVLNSRFIEIEEK